MVITDSGGIQEETTYLGIPCLTVRENTKRPITVSTGTNVLVGRDRDKLARNCRERSAATQKMELCRHFEMATPGSESPMFWLGDSRA